MIEPMPTYVDVLFTSGECCFNFWRVGPILTNRCGI